MAETQTPEQQNEALSKQVTDLKSKLDQKDTTISELKDQLKNQGKDVTALTKERDKAVSERDQAITQRDGFRNDLAAKVERIRELEGDAEANEEVIKRYEAQQKRDQLAAETGSVVVSHEGLTYRVLAPQFHFDGAVVKAPDLAQDAATVAKLIESGSGVLEVVG